MKKRVYEFEANDCRWPLDFNEDGEQLFCCRVASDGLPYCPAHGRMSTASGLAPTPMNPRGEPEFPRARREYLDQSAAAFRREQNERELDLVELLEKNEMRTREIPGVDERLTQINAVTGTPVSRRYPGRLTQ